MRDLIVLALYIAIIAAIVVGCYKLLKKGAHYIIEVLKDY